MLYFFLSLGSSQEIECVIPQEKGREVQTYRKITKLLKSQRLISRTKTFVQTKLKRARLNGCLHMIMLMNSMTMNTKHMTTDHRMIDFRLILLVVKIFRRRKIRQY